MIAGVDQGGDGEPAAGGLSREDDVRRGGAVAQEGLVGGQGVIDRGRIRVLGGEPVVDGDDLGAGPPADLRGEVSDLECVLQDVHAAVEVQDDMAWFDPVDGDLGGRDATERGWGHGHADGQRLRRGQLREYPPLLADLAIGGEGVLPQNRVEALSLLGAHGGSHFGGGLFRPRSLAGCCQPRRQACERASPDHGDSRDGAPGPKVPRIMPVRPCPPVRGCDRVMLCGCAF